MKRRITVIGSTNLDLIMQIDHLPAVGETVAGGHLRQAFGGKGANQAVAAARLGGDVAFVTCVGDDPVAAQIVASYQADGIDTTQLVHAAETPTGTALILLDAQGRNSIALAAGANAALLPAHIDACAEIIAHSAMLVLQMEIPYPTTARAIDIASDAGVPILFNYAPAHDPTFALTSAMTYVVVNEVEAAALSDISVATADDAFAVAERLLLVGPQFVVITLGAGGVVLVGTGIRTHLPAFAVTPIDTTAAGDCFCGALAVALTEGMDLPAAVSFASAAAALSVTRIGAQPSLPTRAEVEEVLVVGR